MYINYQAKMTRNLLEIKVTESNFLLFFERISVLMNCK